MLRGDYRGPVSAGEKNQSFSCCGVWARAFAEARMPRFGLVQIIWLVPVASS